MAKNGPFLWFLAKKPKIEIFPDQFWAKNAQKRAFFGQKTAIFDRVPSRTRAKNAKIEKKGPTRRVFFSILLKNGHFFAFFGVFLTIFGQFLTKNQKNVKKPKNDKKLTFLSSFRTFFLFKKKCEN